MTVQDIIKRTSAEELASHEEQAKALANTTEDELTKLIQQMPQKEVVEEVKRQDQKFWNGAMDGYLKSNLDMAKEAVINKNFDLFIIVDGKERGGKSVLAQQIAKYLDPTFDIENVCMTADEFTKAIDRSEKKKAVIFDEAYQSLSSRGAMSQINKSLNSYFTEMGQKNLFIIIVLPSFFELDKYPAIHRSACLCHVYVKHFVRGRFAFYNEERKRKLYILGKKFYNYRCVPPNFIGKFNDGYVVNKEAYELKKSQSLKRFNQENTTGKKKDAFGEDNETPEGETTIKPSRLPLDASRWRTAMIKMVQGLHKKGMTAKMIADEAGVDQKKVYTWLRTEVTEEQVIKE